ncbi:hypothetical protein TEQG_05628 [Trichophyton equinum CBS 127.97]|uniref:Uncharacterized protein n=1 Tax=Trichophyton equinum (strain ATCC MYA-4606 / CBS 127.97) TaxID=559882 RepID=F2PXL2_TRIEC|nr:hypothetical protein TEQG_05628 [Trichophyton equinum CBS 127.97]
MALVSWASGGPSPPTSTSTSALVRLWESISDADTVRGSGVKGIRNSPGVTTRLRTTPLSGCTAIVVLDELGIILGHIAQEGIGNNIYTLESIPQTGKYLKDTFVDKGSLVFDYGGVREADVHFSQYTARASELSPRSKLVVESVDYKNARRTNVYIANETPVWQRDYTEPLAPARFKFQPGPSLPRLSHNDQMVFESHCDFTTSG